MWEKQNLKTFKTKGVLIAIDPCYKQKLLGMTIPVRPGTWKAMALKINNSEWGYRISDLLVWHSDIPEPFPTKEIGAIGVDSGQAGFFDDHLSIGVGDYKDPKTFYGTCCTITLNSVTQSGTVFNKGVVSSSGYGDGSYGVYCNSMEDTSAIRIEFIPNILKIINTRLDKLPLLIGKYDDELVSALLEYRLKKGRS